jgi:hypothetical protein
VNFEALTVVVICTFVFMAPAICGYDPGRGLIARRGGPAG